MNGALASIHGNDVAREMLDRLLQADGLPHALCLSGPQGVGKRTTALAVGRSLNCLQQVESDCGCGACEKIRRELHPDVRTVAPAGAIFKIDQVRQVQSMARLRAYEGKAKVYILEDADTMNEEAANALLKTLEEPPPDTYLFLTTTRPDALLPTIRSRCRMVRFQPLGRSEVIEILQAQGVEAAEAERRSIFAAGSVGRALALDLPAAEARRALMMDLLESLARRPPASELWKVAREASRDRSELDSMMELLKELARDMTLLARGSSAEACHHSDLAGRLGRLVEPLPADAPLRLFREAERLRTALRGNVARQMATETLLLNARDIVAASP